MKSFTVTIILLMTSCFAWGQISPSLSDPRFIDKLVMYRFASDYFVPLEICHRADPALGNEVGSAIQKYRKEFTDIFSAVESGSNMSALVVEATANIPSAEKIPDTQRVDLIARCKKHVITLNENLDDSVKREVLDRQMNSVRNFLFHPGFFPPDFPTPSTDAQQSAPANSSAAASQ